LLTDRSEARRPIDNPFSPSTEAMSAARRSTAARVRSPRATRPSVTAAPRRAVARPSAPAPRRSGGARRRIGAMPHVPLTGERRETVPAAGHPGPYCPAPWSEPTPISWVTS
jgi:hypothetical protein